MISELREIYGVDYNNNIVDMYVLTESGKYEKVKSMELVKLSEAKEITIYKEDLSTTTISLDENTKVVYINGFEVAYVLQNNVYALVEDEDAWVELEQTHGIPENQKVTEKDGTLYDLVKNGEVKLGTVITGYNVGGYSGEWMIYALSDAGVKILPYYTNWRARYQYQTEIGNIVNCNNVKNELEKYYNGELATGGNVDMLTIAECKAKYLKPGESHFRDFLESVGNIYVLSDDGSLIGVNNTNYYSGSEINSNVDYKIIPVITLDKVVKITAGEYTGRIYK